MVGLFSWKRARNAYLRNCAHAFCRQLINIDGQPPTISFTFDDFPRSALHAGGAILVQFGLHGTYYASAGLMGKEGPPGRMFVKADLDALLAEGHELGCHTFAHCDARETPPDIFADSIVQNQAALRALCPGVGLQTLSYPLEEPRVRIKQVAERFFVCSRSGGQTFNRHKIDLNCLASFFIEQSRDQPQVIRSVIAENNAAGGWLIFSTHDVCKTPSRWGITPELFEDVVCWAAESNARILTVAAAWKALATATAH